MALDKSELSKEKLIELKLHDKYISKQYENIREKSKFSIFYQKVWIEEMLDLVRVHHSNILDYGCGTSILFPFINEKFRNCRYTGIDISDKMLDIGRKRFRKYKNFKVYQQDGENLKFKKETFDLVVSRGAIHHLPYPKKGLKEIRNVLKNGGVLVICEPASNFIIKAFRLILYKFSSHFSSTHRSFTNSELQNLIKKNGFKIIKYKRFGLLAFPFGFPDIIPIFRYFPFGFLKFLVYLDRILLKIPIINIFSWNLIIMAEKINK